MRDLNDLYYYVQVVNYGGFAPAGRALGIPKSKLSRRVALLEDSLGVRLIQRSTRRFNVTELGQEYHRHCTAMLIEADAAQRAIDQTLSAPQGTVRLSCPTALLDYAVGELLARFMIDCPAVQLLVDSTNRRVDVIGEGLDLAIRVRIPPLEDEDLVMKTLGASTQRLVASPRLLARIGTPQVPADLAQLPSLDEISRGRDHTWRLHGADGAEAAVVHRPRLVTDDRPALRISALHGLGIAQLPTMMVLDDLREGRLTDVLPAWRPRPGIIHAVYPSRRGLLPAVRQLIEFLAAGFEQSNAIELASQAAPESTDLPAQPVSL